jgi:hypothetical protein
VRPHAAHAACDGGHSEKIQAVAEIRSVKVSIIFVAFVSVSDRPVAPIILNVIEPVISPVPISVVPIGWMRRERDLSNLARRILSVVSGLS